MGADTRFVDITYRGLKVATKAKLVAEEAGPTGFVEVEGPLPVGTSIVVVDGERSIPARVLGVVEQEAGAKSAPGMRIRWEEAARAEPEAEASTPPTNGAPADGRKRRRTRKTQTGRS